MLRIIVLVFALAGLLSCQRAAPERSACGAVVFEGDEFTVCTFDSRSDELTLRWKGIDGVAYRRLPELAKHLRANDVKFAMNAGMFDPAGAPIGLYVDQGRELHAISTADGPGNFHLKPNGVFWVDSLGDPRVSTTDDFAATSPETVWATQSGPMLVIGGALHPAFQNDGASRYVRNGVGITGKHTAVFVITDGPVSFGKFARLFRDELGAANALYLDGAVSSLWAPSLGRMDDGASLGPLLVVTSR